LVGKKKNWKSEKKKEKKEKKKKPVTMDGASGCGDISIKKRTGRFDCMIA